MTHPEKDSERTVTQETEEHLRSCCECSGRAQTIEVMIESLGQHKDVFCPEQWDLYDYAFHGDDPTGEIRAHVPRCSRCREAITAYDAERAVAGPAPEPFLTRAAQHYAAPDVDEGFFSRITEFLASLFRVPVLLTATATAAAIIVAVVLYTKTDVKPKIALNPEVPERSAESTPPVTSAPTVAVHQVPPQPGNEATPPRAQEPLIALSNETWGQITGLRLMGIQKPKAAILVMIRDEAEKWPQERIDLLYQELDPTEKMRRSFDFVTPDELNKALAGERKLIPTSELTEKMRENFGPVVMCLITIASRTDAYDIDYELVDAKSRHVVAGKKESSIPANELGTTMREAVGLLITSVAPK